VLSESNTVLQDTFAILPGNMLFKDIIRGALAKLEFPAGEAIGAKGIDCKLDCLFYLYKYCRVFAFLSVLLRC